MGEGFRPMLGTAGDHAGTEHAALGRAVGLDLHALRPDHVDARVMRALERLGLRDEAALVARVRSDAGARTAFRRSILISHSGAFRDPEQFALLERQLLPPLLERPGTLRVWSAGCANGLELYSLGLVLERLGALERSLLLGSDLLEENLEAARRASYPELTVPAALRARTRWELRDLATDGPPPGHFELVLCRNVGIYLAPRARAELQRTLAAALARDGVLLLGRSERLEAPAALGLEQLGPNAYRRDR